MIPSGYSHKSLFEQRDNIEPLRHRSERAGANRKIHLPSIKAMCH